MNAARTDQHRRASSRWWLKPLLGVMAVAVVVVAGPAYGRLDAEGKIGHDVDRRSQQVDVVVELSFEAEAFHRQALSAFGVYAGRSDDAGRELRLRAVSQEGLQDLANLYWVRSISAVEPG